MRPEQAKQNGFGTDLRAGLRKALTCGAAAFLLSLGACQGYLDDDLIQIDSSPRGTNVYVDGVNKGQTKLSLKRPYYGTMLVELEKDPFLPGRQFFGTRSQKLTLKPPASPWLFPFDLVLEAVARAFWYRAPNVSFDIPSLEQSEAISEKRSAALTEAAQRASVAR